MCVKSVACPSAWSSKTSKLRRSCKASAPLNQLLLQWALGQVSQRARGLPERFLSLEPLLVSKARCFGAHCSSAGLKSWGCPMWGPNPLHLGFEFALDNAWVAAPGMGFTVRLCPSLFYLLACGPSVIRRWVGAAQTIFRFFPEEAVPYIAADSVYLWDEFRILLCRHLEPEPYFLNVKYLIIYFYTESEVNQYF